MNEICPPPTITITTTLCFREMKKKTGDWFYDQQVNRFSAVPGHDLVKVSLKKKVQCKYRERKLGNRNSGECELLKCGKSGVDGSSSNGTGSFCWEVLMRLPPGLRRCLCASSQA